MSNITTTTSTIPTICSAIRDAADQLTTEVAPIDLASINGEVMAYWLLDSILATIDAHLETIADAEEAEGRRGIWPTDEGHVDAAIDLSIAALTLNAQGLRLIRLTTAGRLTRFIRLLAETQGRLILRAVAYQEIACG